MQQLDSLLCDLQAVAQQLQNPDTSIFQKFSIISNFTEAGDLGAMMREIHLLIILLSW